MQDQSHDVYQYPKRPIVAKEENNVNQGYSIYPRKHEFGR
jgi:hypothetical protein